MPSENTLVLHGTHELLGWLEGRTSRTVAKSPSRVNEGDRDGGYDVEHRIARAFHLQYKSIWNERQTTFSLRDGGQSARNPYCQYKLDLQQHETLLIHNEAINHGFYVLPLVQTETDLPNTLPNTVFVDVYAVELQTDYLYVPTNGSSRPVVYGRRPDPFSSGTEFYEITAGVYTWSDLQRQLQRDEYGFGIRDRRGYTQTYIHRLIRRVLMAHLFDHDWDPSGFASDGGEPNGEFREDIAEYLLDHVIEQRDRFVSYYEDIDYNENVSRDTLYQILQKYAGTRDPSLHGVRRSRQMISEMGPKLDDDSTSSLEDITPVGADVSTADFSDRLGL